MLIWCLRNLLLSVLKTVVLLNIFVETDSIIRTLFKVQYLENRNIKSTLSGRGFTGGSYKRSMVDNVP